jgi:hypothetical protein
MLRENQMLLALTIIAMLNGVGVSEGPPPSIGQHLPVLSSSLLSNTIGRGLSR